MPVFDPNSTEYQLETASALDLSPSPPPRVDAADVTLPGWPQASAGAGPFPADRQPSAEVALSLALDGGSAAEPTSSSHGDGGGEASSVAAMVVEALNATREEAQRRAWAIEQVSRR